jgi:hypothetical protein
VADHRPTELQCEATIIAAAKAAGWRVHGNRAAQTRDGIWSTPLKADKGFPDCVFVRGSEALFVEFKRKPNKVEPEQQKWLDALQAAGLRAFVIWVPEEQELFIARLLRHLR